MGEKKEREREREGTEVRGEERREKKIKRIIYVCKK